MASRPIDEKIVAMKMDNSDFKQKAIETTGLFGRLRESLNRVPGVNLGKIGNDLSGIQRAANGTDLSGLSRSVDAIAGRFSALGVVATTALVNITNRAVNAGLSLSRSLGMDQVTAGFKEYELKIGSIGTVLSNTEWAGTGLEDVNRVFEELNQYADQTIYNFAQMTQNIGRFTAAGVTLDDSATAIKGLGNLAAISGSNTEQLNTAMYQMSQALSSGKLNLMDWNSLINAGMGGKKTQDALLATAKAMGVNVDMSEGFRNSISDGWLSSEIFLETLKQFGEDESMTEAATKVRTFTQMLDTLKEGIGSSWATTWELVFGDFEEATRLWTAVSNLVGGIFQKQGDARNDMLRSVIASDMIPNFLNLLSNAAQPIVSIFKAIGSGFSIAFPPSGANAIARFIEGFSNLIGNMRISTSTINNLVTIFAGFFSMFAIGWDIVKGAVSIILALIPSFSGLGAKIIELIAVVARIPMMFRDAADTGEEFGSGLEILKKIASGVSGALELIVSGLIVLATAVTSVIEGIAKGDMSEGPWKDSAILGWIAKARDAFSSFADMVGSINWSAIGASFSNFFGNLKDGFGWIIDKAVAVGTAIKNLIPDGNQLLAGGFIAGMAAMVGMAIKMSWDLFEVFTGWGKIGAGVAETLEGVGGALESFAWQVKAQALLTIAVAVGVLAGSFWVLSTIDRDAIVSGLYAIIGGLTALVTAMAIMTKYDITGTGLAAAIQIVALSVAMAILAGAIKRMAGLDWGELAKGILGLAGVLGTFSVAMIAISKWSNGPIAASALQMLAIATAMHILVSAIKKIDNLDIGTIAKGTLTIGALLLAMGTFLAIAGKSKFGASSALGILGVATALLIMSKAIKSMGEIDVDVLKQGLITIGIIIAAVSAFGLIAGGPGMLAAGAGILLLAGAMTLLMVPIFALGSMDLATLAKGVGAMAVALLAIGAASMLMTGAIAAGAGLILVAAGLNMLLVPILALSVLSWKSLTVGIVGLAAGILLIGGAAALLGLAGPALLLGAAGIAAVGLAMLAAGAGISLFGAGLVTLAGMTGTAITTIVAMMGTLIMGMISLIPKFTDFIGQLFMKILDKFEEYAPIIISKIYDIVIVILDTLAERTPDFAASATKFIVAFLNAMEENIPLVVAAAASMMVAVITSLAITVEKEGPRFVDAINRLMASIARIIVDAGLTMVNALFGWIPGVQGATAEISANAEEYIRQTFGAADVGTEKGTEFNSALANQAGGAQDAGSTLGASAQDGANSPDMESTGAVKGTEYADGVSSQTGRASLSGQVLANAGKTGAESVDITSSGTFFAQGFANGIGSGSVMNSVKAAAKGLASAADWTIRNVLGIKSPAEVTDESGKWTGQGFANGIGSKAKEVSKSANSVAGHALNWLGIDSEPVKKSNKGGAAAGTSYAKGVSSTKKKSEKAGKDTGKSLAKGLKDSKKDAEKAAKEAAQKVMDAYRKEIENIDYKVDMGEMNTAQQIKAIEKVKKSYAKYPDIVKEVNLKLKRLRDQQTKEIEDAFKKRMDAEKKAISDKKDHNNLSLMQELAAWQKVLNQYKKGTDERIAADKEVFRIKNEINTKLTELNNDYIAKVDEANQKLIDGEKELRAEYEKTVADRAKSLANYVGLFEKVDEMEVANGQELIDNLKSQNRVFERWSSNVWALSTKGLDKALIDELREMGPQAAKEVEALNNMTAAQLTEYNKLWLSKHQLARNSASTELTQLKKDTETKIKELHAQTAKQLAEYQKLWVKSVNEIKNWTKDGFVGMNTSMKTIGEDAIKGLMKGLGNMEGDLKKQAKGIADSVAATIRKALQVKSPSRVLMAIGEFAGEGLAIGLGNKAQDVADNSRNLALTAKDSLNQFLDGFQMDTGDNELHFKAVIDYETLDTKKLGTAGLRFQPDTSFALNSIAVAKNKFRQNDSNSNKTETSKNGSNNNTEDNNTPKQPVIIQVPLNGRVIAEETYEDISQLISRQTNLNLAMR